MTRSVLVLLSLSLSGCDSADIAAAMNSKKSDSHGLEVSSSYFRLMPPGQTVSAGFMVLRNHTATPFIINGAESDQLPRVEVHQHSHEEGVMRMRKVERLIVEAGASLEFKPGGYHLMLFGVPEGVKSGETIKVRLLLANGVEVDVPLIARSLVP